MEPREHKGMMIAATMKIQRSGNAFIVPSQSDRGGYAVDGSAKTCSCPDFELRRQPCKHVFAVEFYLKRETVTDPSGTTTVTETSAVRVTYAQNWPAYNAAQTTEKAHFLTLLRDLCSGVQNPPQGNGRPHLPLGEQVFCATFKVYSGMSARRFATDLRTAHTDGLISDAPAYNSVLRYLEDEELTPIIHELITRSALPLKEIESDFAIDSTGFTSTQLVGLWQSEKYGSKRPRVEHDWLKVHAVCGTKTNVVTAVEVTEKNTGDMVYFKPLFEETAAHFTVREFSADKGYSSRDNLELVESAGAVPYIPFKSSSKPDARWSRKSETWTRLYHFFSLHRDEFCAHYHKRSNIETTFSMIKRVMGDSVRSRTRVAQINEVLLKVLCHNIRVLIHEMHELGIEPGLSVGTVPCQKNQWPNPAATKINRRVTANPIRNVAR